MGLTEPCAADEAHYRIWIEMQAEGAQLAVTARAWAAHDAQLDFALLSDRRNNGNRSRSRQTGKVTLEGGKPQIIGTVKMDNTLTAHYAFSAQLFENGNLVAEKSLDY